MPTKMEVERVFRLAFTRSSFAAGERMLAMSNLEVPVDESTLKRSGDVMQPIVASGQSIVTRIGYSVEYAPIVHKGTRRNKDGQLVNMNFRVGNKEFLARAINEYTRNRFRTQMAKDMKTVIKSMLKNVRIK